MNRSDEYAEIRDIADCVCNEDVTPEQVKQLEILLADDEAAQRFYFEYIGMHIHMQSAAEPNMEIVRRKMHLEEVIIRPVGSDGANTPSPPIDSSMVKTTEAIEPNNDINTKSKKINLWGLLFIALFCLFTALSLYFLFDSSPSKGTNPHLVAEITKGRLNTVKGNIKDSSYLTAGTYSAEKPSIIKLNTGDELSIEKFTRIKIFNSTELELKQGSLQVSQALTNNIEIYTPYFTVNSEGSEVNIDIYNNLPQVTTGLGTTIVPKRWRPKHFWSFDSNSDRIMDLAGNAYGLASKGAKRIEGIVGTGAFEFDNGAEARLNVGSGGGTAPATGSFSVTDGVTIEALVKTQFSGLKRQQDHIFRKDQTDQDMRMLLSFQNDKGKSYLKPEGIFDESISFGLYLVGQGYHELKLPLDGKDGRPTLAQLKDGKAHHIVATYDVTTGIKAIYINGKMLASYQYPAGSKILSGGSGLANIGNSPNHNRNNEAFAGVIDELAFYDFALPQFMINLHFQLTQQGLNYFGLKPSTESLPDTIKIELPKQTTLIIDPLTGLPMKIKAE